MKTLEGYLHCMSIVSMNTDFNSLLFAGLQRNQKYASSSSTLLLMLVFFISSNTTA